nr:MAG TPA: hypothetical protein [Caudoviricetes sp.]DAX31833.1 MAG TPA: hypothetical protein [Caudoviricetes sp.]
MISNTVPSFLICKVYLYLDQVYNVFLYLSRENK